MVKRQEYIVTRHVPGEGLPETVSFGMVDVPNAAVCRHCGKPIAKVPYGASLRWEHTVVISEARVARGVFCETTMAAPDRSRRVRNRYAPREL